MSNVETDQTPMAYEEADAETTLRERLLRNPRPAMIWLAGAVILALLEIGRIFHGVDTLIGIVSYLATGIAGGPGFVGDNFADAIAPVVGAVITAGVTAVILLAVTTPFAAWVPDSVIDATGWSLSRAQRRWAKRLGLTGALLVFLGAWLLTPVGAVMSGLINAVTGAVDGLAETLPSVTSRETIPNQGYERPDGSGWEGTFLGLEPAWAWLIRVTVVLAYATAALGWIIKGLRTYREHYRQADWTPRDDTLRRFRQNKWGLFGFAVVVMLAITALWAPAVSPVPAEDNIYTPATEFQYLNEDGEVETDLHVFANGDSRSNGQNTVGPLSYDDYGRWAPLGTTARGQDMLTHVAYGARTSMVIALTAIGGGALIAVFLSLMSAYYKGVLDVATILASDTIQAVPAILLVMLLSVLFRDAQHPIAQPLDGGFLLALIFAFAYWPTMWRSIRGPSLQVAEREWIDAAKSYGQTPLQTMRKHMAPYIAGYIMIYSSLLMGGIIITTAALTFLGLGIQSPTPEWGRLISEGQSYISTSSFHVATIPGVLIVLVVVAFNALGDALRDAIDPEADVDDSEAASVGGGA